MVSGKIRKTSMILLLIHVAIPASGCDPVKNECWPEMRAGFSELILLHDFEDLSSTRANDLRVTLKKSLARCVEVSEFSYDVTSVDVNGPSTTTLLDIAIAANSRTITKKLVERLRLVDFKEFSAESHEYRGLYIHVAAYLESADAIDELLDLGFDPNAEDENGFTALHVATSQTMGGLLAMRVLVEHGANLDGASAGGITPIMLARLSGDLRKAQCLRALGASIPEQSVFQGLSVSPGLADRIRLVDAFFLSPDHILPQAVHENCSLN